MTPPMYKRVRDVFMESGLTEGLNIQLLVWTDDPNDKRLAKSYIVFRPSGGSNIDKDIGGDYYVMVDIISASGKEKYQEADDTVNRIIEFVKQNPLVSKCLGQITNIGGVPAPILTTERRLVYRLMFACLYGSD
ncbi:MULTISPECIES: phage tail termination protein [unclassified Cedecea]|uniref:phage tail termination protein n=1 Tax=unclassified Cedecea TaxID=2649846 RepID=UPI003016389E